MEDLGMCKFFLGMRLIRNLKDKTITLHEDKHINSILLEYDMSEFQPSSTLMILNSHLLTASDDEITESKASCDNYQRAFGLVNYLVLCTILDLTFVASPLSQFLNKTGPQH